MMRKATLMKHKAARARSRLDELTRSTFLLPVSSFDLFLFCFFGDVAFTDYYISLPIPFCPGSSTSYVFPFRVVFFYLVTTSCISDVSSYDNSLNQFNRRMISFSVASIVL